MSGHTPSQEIIKRHEIALICTSDGKQWWKRRETSPSHTENMFYQPEPQVGDLLIEGNKGPTIIRRMIKVGEKGVLLSMPYQPYYPKKAEDSNTDRMDLKTGTVKYYRLKEKS